MKSLLYLFDHHKASVRKALVVMLAEAKMSLGAEQFENVIGGSLVGGKRKLIDYFVDKKTKD